MTSAYVELEHQIKEAGKQLLHPPGSVDALLPVLDRVEKLLSKVDQSPKRSMIEAMKPSMRALIHDRYLKHSDVDVKVAVASCISEITRITAPDAPYDDNQMKDVFQLIVSSFEGIADQSSRSYNKRASILETVSKVRSCVIMLDLECDALIVEMFEHFLKSVRDYHIDSIFPSMENIMVLVLEESEEIPTEMLKPLLASVKKDNTEVPPIARKLAEGVLLKSAEKLKPYLMPALTSLGESLDMYTKVVTSVCEGSNATFENNDENTSVIQPADEIKLEKGSEDETPKVEDSKVTTASSEQTDQVVKEASREEEVDPSVDKSPKSVMSNGGNVTGNEEASVDQEPKKAEEDVSQQRLNKEDTDDSDTDKKGGKKADTVINSAEPSDSSHVEGEKDNENENENENEKDDDVKEPVNEKDDEVKDSVSEKDNDVKDSESEKENDDKESESEKESDVKDSESEKDNDVKESENEAAVPSETEKDDVQVSSQKAKESKPAVTTNVSSPSQSNSLPDERPVRSKKKKVPYEGETASPSNGEVPPDDETLVKNVGRTKGSGKKAVIAKEIKLPETVNESEDDGATSDSDEKPLKKSEPKSKSKSSKKSGKKSKQSGKKVDVGESDSKKSKQTDKKVDVKADDNDSDAKPLKMSVKKGEKSKITVEEEEDSDSENKPLKLSAKKSSSKKKDSGKKRGNGKSVADKEQAKSLSEDDEMDSSPKSVKKSAKAEGNSKETPVTSAKRKRSAVKDNTPIKYDESLVGTKVKVWWPEDKMFYEGVIEEFYPAKKKHKVSYLDGDEEKLNLRTQRWEILQEFSQRDDKEQTTEAQSQEASPQTHKKKRSKTEPASSSQEKAKDSSKKVGGVSSSGKSTKEKSGAKSAKKATASKDAGKSEEDEETPKASTKTKAVTKSKGKTPPSGSKSNTNGPTKAKSGSSVKESDNVKTPESGKGKSTEPAKGGSKSGNKRKKRS